MGTVTLALWIVACAWSMTTRAERRAVRASRPGFAHHVPDGFAQLLVPSHLLGRARAQVQALQLHDECNKAAGRDFHYLAQAIEGTVEHFGEKDAKAARRVNKKATAARHDWGSSNGSPAVKPPAGTSRKVTLLLDELVERDNSSTDSVDDKDKFEDELQGTSVLISGGQGGVDVDVLEDEDLEFGTENACSYNLCNFPARLHAGEFGGGELHDDCTEASRQLQKTKNSHVHGKTDANMNDSSARKWVDCCDSDGDSASSADEAALEFDGHTLNLFDEKSVEITSDKDSDTARLGEREFGISKSRGDDEIDGEDTFASASCGRAIEAYADEAELHEQETLDVDVHENGDLHDSYEAHNAALLHENDSDTASWEVSVDMEVEQSLDCSFFQDGNEGLNTARLGRTFENLHNTSMRVWQHTNLESILHAPWRQRRKQAHQFDLTISDSPDDYQYCYLTPPGQFLFSAKPGFGIRDILHEECEAEPLHELRLHEDNTLHDEAASQDAALHDDAVQGDEEGLQVHDHILHADSTLHDLRGLQVHGEDGNSCCNVAENLHGLHEERGFVFRLASYRDAKWVECIDAGTFRALVFNVLQHVYLVGEAAANISSQKWAKEQFRDFFYKASSSRDDWKDRALLQQAKSKRLQSELTEVTRLKEQVANLKIINEKLINELQRERYFRALAASLHNPGFEKDWLGMTSICDAAENTSQIEHERFTYKSEEISKNEFCENHPGNPGPKKKKRNPSGPLAPTRKQQERSVASLTTPGCAENPSSAPLHETGPLGSSRNSGNPDFFTPYLIAGKFAAIDTSKLSDEPFE